MFYIGLDLGQVQDYTALCVLERVDVPTGKVNSYRQTEAHIHARHLERFRLGTPYPAVVERVKSLAESDALRGDYCIVADATGVGHPVVDLLYGAGLRTVAVTITGGSSVTDDVDGYHVPKRDLVSNLQVLLQSGRLKFAEGLPEVPTLIKELLAFQVKITANAHDTYGAWREGAHDDLVLSVALATWYAERYGGPLILFEVDD